MSTNTKKSSKKKIKSIIAEGGVTPVNPSEAPETVTTSTPEVSPETPSTTQVVAAAAVASLPGNRKHRPRPEVRYTLVTVPPIGSVCPQEQQIVQALQVKAEGADAPFSLTEPEAFQAVVAAAADGKLVTKQDPVRILKYYTPSLRKHGVLDVSFDTAAKAA